MQYYSGRVVKPDQTKLDSTKPNKELLLYDSNLASSNSIKSRNSTGLHFAGQACLLMLFFQLCFIWCYMIEKKKKKGCYGIHLVSERKREAEILLMKPHACLEYFLLDPFFFHIVPVITLWGEESLIKTLILIKYFRSYLQKNFSFEPLVCAWYRICKRNSSYCGLASICHPLPHEVQDELLIKSNRMHWQNSDICYAELDD